MIEAQWGLKAQLLGHPCSGCATTAGLAPRMPRGARPGDVLGALRREAIRNSLSPASGPACGQPQGLAGPVSATHADLPGNRRVGAEARPTPRLEFANVFPIPVSRGLFFTVSGFVLLAFGVGLSRCIRATKAWGATGSIPRRLLPALREIMTHERFWACDKRNWSLGHLLTLWGFAGLAVVGTATGIGTMAGVLHTPLALTSGLKILANTSALVILGGSLILPFERAHDPIKQKASADFMVFPADAGGGRADGNLAEVMRLAQFALLMYPVYFVHLVLIFALFLYAPYSKFAHLAYRTVVLASAGPWKPKAPITPGGRVNP